MTIGEHRHTSAGNVFRLEWQRNCRCGVRRVAVGNRPVNGKPDELWDHDVVYCWMESQWESIPLVGEDTSSYPQFGLFGSLNF